MPRNTVRESSRVSVIVLFITIGMLLAALAVLAQQPTDPWRRIAVPSRATLQTFSAPSVENTPTKIPQTKTPSVEPLSPDEPLFLPAVLYPSGGTNASSVAVADLNGDSVPDLVVTNWSGEANGDGTVSVLLGTGNGTFGTPVSYDAGVQAANSVAVGDVNGDGVPDLIVAGLCTICVRGLVSVLLGNGDGTFQSAITYGSGGVSPHSVAVADLNGDGKLDLIVANYFNTFSNATSGAIGVLLGNGDGTFQTAVAYDTVGIGATDVAVADLRGINKLDLVVSDYAYCPQYGQGCIVVLLGNGNGTFQPAVAVASGSGYSSVVVADVNGDHVPDIVATTGSLPDGDGEVDVLIGNGNGTFQTAVAYDAGGKQAESAVAADVNGDGKPDLIVANACTTGSEYCSSDGVVDILLNSGNGIFQPPVTYSSNGSAISSDGDSSEFLAVADVNGDGKPDIVVPNFGSSTIGVLLNNVSPSQMLSATTAKSSMNPSKLNQLVTFTATVTSASGVPGAPHPEGTITFYRGFTPIGAGTLVNGRTSILHSMPRGSHPVTAAYQGSSAFLASTSAAFIQIVAGKAIPSAMTLTTSGSPSLLGQPLTFTATVTSADGSIPDGETVLFYRGALEIGRSRTVGGVTTFTTANLAAGKHTIRALYPGYHAFGESTASLIQVVEK
jgi:Bacterial Ig-like domain (group 3)/FG-GAP-like repeat